VVRRTDCVALTDCTGSGLNILSVQRVIIPKAIHLLAFSDLAASRNTALARRGPHGVQLLSRRGRPMGAAFPEIVAAVAALPEHVTLDGELVVPTADGRSDFKELRRRHLFKLTIRFTALPLKKSHHRFHAVATLPWWHIGRGESATCDAH